MHVWTIAEAPALLCAVFPEVLDDNSAVLCGPVLKSLLQACPYTVVNTSVNMTEQASTH